MTVITEIVEPKEKMVGTGEKKYYLFHILSCNVFSKEEGRIIGCYRKGDICGGLFIWEMEGNKSTRQIDSNSEIGRKILEELGYKKC